MIIPSKRLLAVGGWVVAPLGGVAGMIPESAPAVLGGVGMLALVLIYDALRAGTVLEGVRVRAPETVRFVKGRVAMVRVWVERDGGLPRGVRMAIRWPGMFRADREEVEVGGANGGEEGVKAGVGEWRVRALERGRWSLKAVGVEGRSVWGFWQVRRVLECGCELRVYPDLRAERRGLARFLLKGTSGVMTRRRVGQGREFEQLREYVAGDGYDVIHWKATARRGAPVTKVFRVERTQEVYVWVDGSRLSGRRQGGEGGVGGDGGEEDGVRRTVLDRAIASALMLGATAERQGDLFGVGAFDDRVRVFVGARNGRRHSVACREALHGVMTREVTPDYEEVCSFLRVRLRKRALVVFVAALDDPMIAESFLRGVELIRRQHLVMVMMPRPGGARPLFSADDVGRVDEIYSRLGGHLRWRRLKGLELELKQRGVIFHLVDDAALSVEMVSRYFEVKARQMI